MVYRGIWKDQIVAVKKLFCDDMEDKEYESFQMEIELMRFDIFIINIYNLIFNINFFIIVH